MNHDVGNEIIYNTEALKSNFCDYNDAIDSYIKQYEEIRKLATSSGQDYTAGCLFDYEYAKNH